MKTILLTVLCSIMFLGANAGGTAREAFVAAPRTVLPLLDHNTRLDMLDYYDAGLSHTTKNALDGGSRVLSVDANRILIEMTDASTLEIDLLPGEHNSNTIAVISTVHTPAANSTIAFYDEAWHPFDASKIFTAPQISDWITDKNYEADVTMLTPFVMSGYTYSPSDKTLTAFNNTEAFLGKDMYESISAWMRPQIVYQWDGKKFKQQ